jgi:alkylation response protein AidB-like acyl-CoA dehydrogenase
MAEMSAEMKEERNRLLRESVMRIASTKVAKRAAEIDRAGVFPWDMVELFGQQGFLSIMLPESLGGMQGDISA